LPKKIGGYYRKKSSKGGETYQSLSDLKRP